MNCWCLGYVKEHGKRWTWMVGCNISMLFFSYLAYIFSCCCYYYNFLQSPFSPYCSSMPTPLIVAVVRYHSIARLSPHKFIGDGGGQTMEHFCSTRSNRYVCIVLVCVCMHKIWIGRFFQVWFLYGAMNAMKVLWGINPYVCMHATLYAVANNNTNSNNKRKA